MKLIQFSSSNRALEQACVDLDILKLLQMAEPSFSDKQAAEWALDAFDSRQEELSARARLFTDVTSLEEAREAWQATLQFAGELDQLQRTADTLHEVLYGYRSLKAFLALVDALKALCAGASASERLLRLKQEVAQIEQDPAFSRIRAVTQEIPSVLPFPRHMYVALNARETGDATDIGVIRDDAESTRVQALLDSQAPTGPTRSLFPEMSYTRAQYGTHFEEYLLQHFEKHYHGEIGKAHKLLQNMHPLKEQELLELESSLRYLVIGLLMKQLFRNAGYALCLPDPTGDSLQATGLMYPDLALHMQDLEGKDVRLTTGSSTLITGANHSGKTSYLKTVGQSLILAQFGFPVPAASFRYRPFQTYYTLFSSGEDSSMSVSRMGVEIQRLSVIMNDASARDLVLINEPMTSTNPVEAVSICADLMERFLAGGITHLVVTHLYDIYYLLQARLSTEQKARFISLITLSSFSETEGMVHSYRLQQSAPLGNSYAMETAKSFRITLEDLMEDPARRAEAAAYCRASIDENIYGGGDARWAF